MAIGDTGKIENHRFYENISSYEELMDYIDRMVQENVIKPNVAKGIKKTSTDVSHLKDFIEMYEGNLEQGVGLEEPFEKIIEVLEELLPLAAALTNNERDAGKNLQKEKLAVYESINNYLIEQALVPEIKELLKADKYAERKVHDTPLKEIANFDKEAIKNLITVLMRNEHTDLTQAVKKELNN